MRYSYRRLSLMSDRRLRVLQFAYFCMNKAVRMGDRGGAELAIMQRDITHALTLRNARIFGPECLLNVHSDPRWEGADNRRRGDISNDA